MASYLLEPLYKSETHLSPIIISHCARISQPYSIWDVKGLTTVQHMLGQLNTLTRLKECKNQLEDKV